MKNFILALAVCFFISCKKDKEDPVQPQPIRILQVDNAISNFMSQYNVPGTSVAITKNGKLVYSSSYGKTDVSAGTDVSNNSLFRIASVSKPITAIAILKLAEAGGLSLDQKVFGAGSILGMEYGTPPYGAGVTDITIRQLLNHTSGGWPNNASDPMFNQPGMSHEQLISWILDNTTLNSTPGTSFAYSNFGYCILGRVIEKVSGQTYEQYVKSAVLQPAGISSMSIGGDTEAQRKPNEVKYYGQGGQDPYAHKITRMDANGGWIATATDLARLLVRVDGFNTKPDILNASSINAMTSPPSSPGYALGWNVNNNNNWWHAGSLPGSSSIIVRSSSGFNWVILCNTRSSDNQFITDLDALLWPVITNSSITWPDVDLF